MTTPNVSMNAALAFLANTYATAPLPETAEPIVVTLPASAAKPKKEKGTKKSKGEKSAPKAPSAMALPSNMPAIGSIDATTFLTSLRGVGMRSVEDTNAVTGEVTVRKFHDATFDREDTIKLIHAFVGYDPTLNFGEQDVAARAEAQRRLRGGVIPAAAHRKGGASVALSITGYVAGCPDGNAKLKANLEAQARLATDTICDLRKKPADEQVDVGGMSFAADVLLAIEEERLEVIRKDLAAL